MTTQFNPARRMFTILVLIVLFFSIVSMACGGSGCGDTVSMSDAQCTGTIIVETVSTGRTDAEQAVHDLFGCNPETALYGCNADGSFK